MLYIKGFVILLLWTSFNRFRIYLFNGTIILKYWMLLNNEHTSKNETCTTILDMPYNTYASVKDNLKNKSLTKTYIP